MPDFLSFISMIPTPILVIPMMAVGLLIFAPTTAVWGLKKIESLFGINFKDGFSLLEAQKKAKEWAREYYRNNSRKNRPVPYKFWRR